MTQYHGRCHCGAVKFSHEGETIESGLRCMCSLCARRGAIMTPGHFRVNVACIDAIEDPYALDISVFDGKHLL